MRWDQTVEIFGYSKKDFNSFWILNYIQKSGALSRTQLASLTKLPPATITNITHDFLESGVLEEAGATTTGRGRNQTLLQISRKLCAIGMNVERDQLVAILSDVTGTVLQQVRRTYERDDTPQHILDLVLDCIHELIRSNPEMHIIGIAVGDPGSPDSTGEHSLVSTQLNNWKKISIKHHIQDHFNLPVFVEMNDRLKALAEMRYGIAAGCSNFICLHLGYGIGMSLVCEGRLVRGNSGYAGEFGHIPLAGHQELCPCGSRGCLETQTSLAYLFRSLQEALQRGIPSYLDQICPDTEQLRLEHLCQALEHQDRLVSGYVYDIADRLGDAVSSVVTLLNPKMVIFQGQMCALGEPLTGEIQSVIRRKAFPFSLDALEFHVSSLGDLAGPLGASTLVFDDFLHSNLFE